MKRFFSVIIIISISVICIAQGGHKINTSEFQAERIYDSLEVLNNEIVSLKLRLFELETELDSSKELFKYTINQADSRVGWVLGISGLILTITILGAGFLTYVNVIKEARETLKDFDHKVDEKLNELNQKDTIGRIKYAFDCIGKNSNSPDDIAWKISVDIPAQTLPPIPMICCQ